MGNLEKIAHGQTESPLNDRGVRQAKETAGMLRTWERKFDRVYASPLSRAKVTGTHIAASLQLPIAFHDDLKEGNLGDWEGVTYQALDDFGFVKHSIKDDDFDGHNGESPNMLGMRMANAVSEISASHERENIIFVSHGAAIAHFLARTLGTRPAFGHQYLMHNAAVTEVRLSGGEAELLTLNFFDHLPDDLRADIKRDDQHVRE